VLGISLGGMVAQALALNHPERVGGLILGCTMHGGREAHPVDASFISLCAQWAEEESPNESAHLEGFIRSMLPPEVLAQPSGGPLLETFREAFTRTPRSAEGLRGQLAAMSRFNSTRSLEALGERHRTLVICGDQDAVMPAANSESLARRIPNAELVMRPGAGHFFWASPRPGEASIVLARFLLECDALGEESSGTAGAAPGAGPAG